jgi:hypothetical protein
VWGGYITINHVCLACARVAGAGTVNNTITRFASTTPLASLTPPGHRQGAREAEGSSPGRLKAAGKRYPARFAQGHVRETADFLISRPYKDVKLY